MAQAASEIAALPPRVVPSLAAVRWRLVLWLSILTLGVLALAASYLAYTGSMATTSYNIQRLQLERDAWRMRNDQLRAELSRMRSLTWVEHEAVSGLGMQKPTSLVYVPMEPLAPTVEPRAASGRR